MRMFLNEESHYDFIGECLDLGPKRTIISTFGIYAGITAHDTDMAENGHSFRPTTRNALDRINQMEGTTLLVGVHNYRSCRNKEQCLDCEIMFTKSLIRTLNHAERFPNITWRLATELHLKCAIFLYGSNRTPRMSGIAGGRNFTGSGWADASFELSEQQVAVLYKEVNRILDTSLNLDINAIQTMLERFQISQEAFDRILQESA